MNTLIFALVVVGVVLYVYDKVLFLHDNNFYFVVAFCTREWDERQIYWIHADDYDNIENSDPNEATYVMPPFVCLFPKFMLRESIEAQNELREGGVL